MGGFVSHLVGTFFPRALKKLREGFLTALLVTAPPALIKPFRASESRRVWPRLNKTCWGVEKLEVEFSFLLGVPGLRLDWTLVPPYLSVATTC